MSVETIALIAAAGTALGALIGAASGGVVDFLLDRAREKRDAKVGARLVRLDLALAASQLKAAEQEGKWSGVIQHEHGGMGSPPNVPCRAAWSATTA